jgi:hypothetical protein
VTLLVAGIGKFENDKANFERQSQRRQSMINEIARANNIRGLDEISGLRASHDPETGSGLLKGVLFSA